MTVRNHEQKALIEKVQEILDTYRDFDLVCGELASLGFVQKSIQGDPSTVENIDLEVYVRMYLDEKNEIRNYEIMTFDEIVDLFKEKST